MGRRQKQRRAAGGVARIEEQTPLLRRSDAGDARANYSCVVDMTPQCYKLTPPASSGGSQPQRQYYIICISNEQLGVDNVNQNNKPEAGSTNSTGVEQHSVPSAQHPVIQWLPVQSYGSEMSAAVARAVAGSSCVVSRDRAAATVKASRI